MSCSALAHGRRVVQLPGILCTSRISLEDMLGVVQKQCCWGVGLLLSLSSCIRVTTVYIMMVMTLSYYLMPDDVPENK